MTWMIWAQGFLTAVMLGALGYVAWAYAQEARREK